MKRKRAYGRRKRTFKRRKARRMSGRKRILRVVNSQIETKWRYGTTGPSTTTSWGYDAPFCVGLSNEAKGTDVNQRVGNRIRAKMLEFNIKLCTQAPTASYVPAAYCRVVIFWDRANNLGNFSTLSAAAQVALLFADGATGNAYQSPFNPNFVPARFQIIRDLRIALNTVGGQTDVPNIKIRRLRIPLKGKLIQYDSTNAGNPTDIQKNALYVFMTMDVGSTTTARQPNLSVEYLFTYKDA